MPMASNLLYWPSLWFSVYTVWRTTLPVCYKCYFCLPWGIFDKHTCGCNRKQVTSGWRMTLNVLHVLSPWTVPVTTVNGRSLISSINSLIRCSHFQTRSITIDLLTRGTRACCLLSVVLTSLQDGVCSNRIIRSGGNRTSPHSEVVCAVFHPTISQRHYRRNNVFDRRW